MNIKSCVIIVFLNTAKENFNKECRLDNNSAAMPTVSDFGTVAIYKNILIFRKYTSKY